MAITYTKQQEQLARQQQPVQSNKPYNGMQGMSGNTANNLGNYQQGYKPSEQTQNYQNQLQQAQAQKPQAYSSKYQPQLDSILQQIQNPGQFKYEFNGDNLFKYYADLYSQNGKQAAMDVMGQAAGLTGGYGNSYGQQVAQQQYNEYMRPLYDRGMELYDRAYQRYADQLGNLQNAYNYTANAEDRDYGRYQDELGNWQNERAYATDMMNNERNFDYNQYQTDLNYWTNMAQQEASMAEQQRQYDTDNTYRYDAMAQDADQFAATDKLNWAKLEQDQNQFDANLTEEQRQYNQNVAIDYVSSILANGQIPSNELLVAAGLSLEDAQKLIAQIQQGGAGGNKPKKEEEEETNGKNAKQRNSIMGGGLMERGSAKIPDTVEYVQGNGNTVDRITNKQTGAGQSMKSTTTTMTQQEYNRMIQELLEEEMKRSNK